MITWIKKIRPVTGMHTITVTPLSGGGVPLVKKSFNTSVFTTPNQSPIIKSNPTMSIINNFPAGKMTHIRRCINLSDVEKGLNMQIGSTLPS
jgi:hypothetical protein